MYGVYVWDKLILKCKTAIEAYESALYAYEETGLFYEVRLIKDNVVLDMQVKTK